MDLQLTTCEVGGRVAVPGEVDLAGGYNVLPIYDHAEQDAGVS